MSRVVSLMVGSVGFQGWNQVRVAVDSLRVSESYATPAKVSTRRGLVKQTRFFSSGEQVVFDVENNSNGEQYRNEQYPSV